MFFRIFNSDLPEWISATPSWSIECPPPHPVGGDDDQALQLLKALVRSEPMLLAGQQVRPGLGRMSGVSGASGELRAGRES